MDPDQAEQLARDLMKRHGLTRCGWRFAWTTGKRQLGAAMIRKTKDRRTGRTSTTKTIRLSRHLVALNDDAEVRDTILHEIAHALAGLENGHNAKWKAVCRKIGANPQRLAGEHVVMPQTRPPRYHIVCGTCRQSLGPRHRRMDPKRLAAAYCRHCGPRSKGTLKLAHRPDKPADAQPTTAGGASAGYPKGDADVLDRHPCTTEDDRPVSRPKPEAPAPAAPLFAASS